MRIKNKRKNIISKKKPITKFQKATKFFSVLGEVHLVEFEHRLSSGDKYPEIIKWLKGLGYFNDKQSRTVIDAVSMYNTQVVKMRAIAAPTNVEAFKQIEELLDKVNALDETSELVIKQKHRLKYILELEKGATSSTPEGVLTKAGKDLAHQARKEIQLMSVLVEKLLDIQVKIGKVKLAPKFISGDIVQDDSDPSKITFNIKEDFMENLQNIEHELGLSNIIDVKEIEADLEEETSS